MEEYDWSLILKVAVPISIVEAYIFYSNLSIGWKWALLVLGMASAGMVTYFMDKKKGNIFTASGIVFLVALVVKSLKELGFF